MPHHAFTPTPAMAPCPWSMSPRVRRPSLSMPTHAPPHASCHAETCLARTAPPPPRGVWCMGVPTPTPTTGDGRPSLTPTLCGRRSSRGPLYIGNCGPDPGRISASHVGGFGPWTKNEYTRSARRLAYIITKCGAGQTRRGILSCLYALLPATPTITCFEQRQGPVGDTATLRRTHHNHIHTSAGAVTDNHDDEHRVCTT